MTANSIVQEAAKLPIEQRIQILEEIWKGVTAELDTAAVAQEQEKELLRRQAEFKRDPSAGVPWDVVRKQYKTRS